MDLSGASTYFCTTSLEVYDPGTDTWSDEGLLGNIVPTDRFVSIYNRPVHLRQLTFPIGAPLPASRILRNNVTGEVYMLGQERRDTRAGTAYVGTVMLHLVTGEAGALTALHRKAPTGPANDPGFIADSEVITTYFDIELRSALESDQQVAASRGEYLLWAPSTVAMQPWDFIEINSDWFRVHQVYFDSGFQMARVFKERDDRENLVFKSKTAKYNTDSGDPGGYTSYNITGLVDSFSTERNNEMDISPSVVDLRVMTDHIGFDPSVNDKFTLADGYTYAVTKVAKAGARDEWLIKGQA